MINRYSKIFIIHILESEVKQTPPHLPEGIPDPFRPLEPSILGASGHIPYDLKPVHAGLQRSPESHHLGTLSNSVVTPASQKTGFEEALADEQPAVVAQHLANGIGTRDCHLFRKNIFESHSQFALPLASNYLHIAKKKTYIEANLQLLSIDKRLKIGDINFSCTTEDLKAKASQLATHNKNISIQSATHEKSMSNPHIRQSELMVRKKG